MDLGIDQQTGLTRRTLLGASATAGAAVALGVRPRIAAAAGPDYLTRSAYSGLEGTSFTVETGAEPVLLRLEAVSDVAGAATKRALAGSDDAFALRFSGPLSKPLDSGIHTLRHPSIGTFELFSSPVDDPEEDRHYEAVIDRSVGVSRAPEAPEAKQPPPQDVAETGSEAPPTEAEREPEPDARVVRRVSLRRAGRWARCELVLLKSVSAERVRCRLLRKGRLVATAARDVTDRRAVMRLEAAQPLRSGAYTLVVTAVHADGTKTSERRRVTFR
jgi:hypothetical protein